MKNRLADAELPVPQAKSLVRPGLPYDFGVDDSAIECFPKARLQPNVERSEGLSLLLAFGTHRAAIHAVAITIYKRERKCSYELVAADFSPRD